MINKDSYNFLCRIKSVVSFTDVDIKVIIYFPEQLRILQSVGRKDIPRIKSSDDFEKLTKALRRTKAGKTLLENVPDNPLFCTHGTHRCIHATHAYTGIPCAAYSKLNFFFNFIKLKLNTYYMVYE